MSLRAGRDLFEGAGSVKLSTLFLSIDNLVNTVYKVVSLHDHF